MIEFDKAKWRLALLWFGVCGFLFFIVFLQTILDKYGQRSTEVWNWLLPNLMPVLTMMAGVIVSDMKAAPVTRFVQVPFYYFAGGLSCFYLLLIAVIILLGPVIEETAGLLIFDVIGRTGVFLGPMQGVVASAVGIFFLKKTEKG
ncbi:hypothetical protein FMN50_01730 [Rhodobacterales bacterium]|nr:hypothetical protein FMN50_01730 [Rhodobacterales bacterium]